MWGLFNYLWQNAVQASVGMQQCALGNLWTAESKGCTEVRKGEMAEAEEAEDQLERDLWRDRGKMEERWAKEAMEDR